MHATAEDLWPLVAKLSRKERMRLARFALAAVALPPGTSDAERYLRIPVSKDEFASTEKDPLAWDADGWDEFA